MVMLRDMLRLLLTCLAFLTGLVAVGTPASAMYAESTVTRASADVCEDDSEDARCVCQTSIRLRDWRIVVERKCHLREPMIFVPTVYFGADRAFE
ncbi:hypothetical protein [Alteriqipengyuania sp. 357]